MGVRGTPLHRSPVQPEDTDDATLNIQNYLNTVSRDVDDLDPAEQTVLKEDQQFMAKPLFRGEKGSAWPTGQKQLSKRNVGNNSEDELQMNRVPLPWEMNYFNPMLRGKKSPAPPMWLKQLIKRDEEIPPEDGRQVNSIILPWQMNYFTPMLRGK